ncbi:MAG TPA: class I SAM-dependent methyltransferase [Candidatus Solibacter sp.]|nr:class I SAM-dependent methyltransferase [Candidatus Solibacter sp.]
MKSANDWPKPHLLALEHSGIMAAIDRIATSHDDRTPCPTLVDDIAGLLLRHRGSVRWEEWREFATATFRAHNLFPTLQSDPYASYSFRKPRGYPGDAVLMDFIYGDGSSGAALESSSELGRSIFQQISQNPAFPAIQGRRDLLARRIETACQENPTCRILCVACGHLREGGALRKSEMPKPARFVALDQDEESLALVASQHDQSGVECVRESAMRLLSNHFDIGEFDLIYSAGLYDYLSDEFSTRLIQALVRRLAPGGTLLVANMLPDIPACGYMEAVMDWWLIYRTPEQMAEMGRQVAAVSDVRWRVFTDDLQHIVYLEIGRKS